MVPNGDGHEERSRGILFEELDAEPDYHFMRAIAEAAYGTRASPQWHFGNGPDKPPTSVHMSVEGLRQGDAAASIYFNIIAARVYREVIKLLAGRGILLAIADDVKIVAPPAVLAEVAAVFPDLAWTEAGLETQAVKNRVFVQESAREAWLEYLETNEESPLHGIPDGARERPEDRGRPDRVKRVLVELLLSRFRERPPPVFTDPVLYRWARNLCSLYRSPIAH